MYLPGDIVGFSSCSQSGFWVNIGTLGLPFWSLSHVAIVGLHPNTGTPVLFEATSLCDMRCAVKKRKISGVQAHYPDIRVRRYHGKAWHYQLKKPLTVEQSAHLTDFCVGHIGIGYDAIGALRARSTALGLLERHWRPENLQALFCSEFCAAAERAIGVFNTGDASKWNPNSFVRALRRRAIVGKPTRKK